MTAIAYRGYFANVEFDAEDEIFAGRLAGINDVVGFHADNVDDLKSAFREAVDDYIETCAKTGKTAEKPYSGQIMVRIDPAVHAQAALAAQLTGKSLTKWTEERLREAAERDTAAAVAV
ncbi:type II toxin-antitoxin system HicB family antitoxin [Phenylobacterium sp.]|uniref:type II toxin-antitoxin system HicB family antitoxin n=1 Tax=Phenylobacterium sp. TaxID=1871053 RepID=UPI00286E5B42|nr:type II toxin-antitoxin system HicB family antitoxin [Phenylobacterium sp.]